MMIVDRIEGETAVCEDGGSRTELSLSQLPAGVREGDVLVFGPEGWQIDRQATDARRAAMIRRSRRLFHRRNEVSKEPR
ncbi:MAG: DUF3006 domain-containing protein [Oscillospiraceae bacterium]|nr:DUF3006 domain-containing protein [Oscillospiraceae bacterium]